MQLDDLNAIAEKHRSSRKKIIVRTCMSAGCMSSQADVIKKNLEAEAKAQGLDADVEVRRVGCMGFCGQGPLVGVDENGQHGLWEFVKPEDAPAIIAALKGGECKVQRGDPKHPFFAKQMHIVRANGGIIDPERIEDYIAIGGYKALHHSLTELQPAQVVEEITKSGLRGRGGAGFPTGLKWGTVAKSPGAKKYIVCNGDEGDPGAFMDRSVLESDPHLVLEGMAIAAYAVGADQGYLYVRAEYPLAISRLQIAIKQAKQLGLLGAGVFETPFNFNVDIRIGAGAFVCGEETALMASVEGKRGTPRPRPPFPAASGLWGCPTLINNVETFANISAIINRGGAWYAGIGTEKSKGTKVFALTGKIKNNGLIEVPMGIPLRQIVMEMGGGAPDGRQVKSVQTGGPSGGCIPADYLDTPVDYESLTKLGSIMGSGGMVVMDDSTNMVEIAKFYMEFCMEESCGKCIPCRAGTVQMFNLLEKITQRKATARDLAKLEELCDMVKNTSLCGLGQTAPNPVVSTLKFFRKEYEELLQPDPFGPHSNGAAKPQAK
ncbi:MAG: NADH-ubiquinone oxidoreductase-F iron-sulfur binding region domain-containing protein [Verrucomicrobiae bacterium]|nr:NADH-ubiquinone oxidoreductase-F iron-sulfur binding region domain-containing protein [Verrucomicrobiae bacterium]